MYGFLFRPKWLMFHALVIAGIVSMISAGFWQLDRLDQRQSFNDEVFERSQTEPTSISSVLQQIEDGSLTPEQAEWLPVTIEGTYLPEQVVEFNNSQGGRAGDNVLTALVRDDEDAGQRGIVIVNRGFIPLGFDVPPAPQIEVNGVGYVRTSEVRSRGGLTDADDGQPLTEIRRIDIPRLAQQFEGDVAPVYVQLIATQPPIVVGDPEPVVLPELSNGSHLSYAMQWFVFSICVLIGWVLAVRRSIRSNVRGAASATSAADSPSSTEREAATTPAGTSTS
ncbi:MAG: SURF1 family protein [Ilumatobacter sp.]